MLAARVGWESGTLGHSLKVAAVQLTDRRQPPYEPWSGVAVYLVSLSLAAAAIISFLMYYIIPKFKKIFVEQRALRDQHRGVR
jgi:type II secretory pathway component PulF